jgi:hypothetical protein
MSASVYAVATLARGVSDPIHAVATLGRGVCDPVHAVARPVPEVVA